MKESARDIGIFVLVLVIGFLVFGIFSPTGNFISLIKPTVDPIVKLQTDSASNWQIRYEWDKVSSLIAGKSKEYAGNAQQVANDFVLDNKDVFGGGSFEIFQEKKLPKFDAVSLIQTYKGLPVFDSKLTILVDGSNVIYAGINAKTLGRINTRPAFSSEQALSYAVKDLDAEKISSVNSKLGIYEGKLAYEISFFVGRGYNEPWRYTVNAQNGQILFKEVLMQKNQARIFEPNPVVTTGNLNLMDQSNTNYAEIMSAYFEKTLTNLDSPVDGLYSLKGDYVWMKNIDIPTNIPPNSTGDFFYYRDKKEFEDVMVYSYVTESQKYIQSLGFYDANNRPIEVDAHGLFNQDNSAYLVNPGDSYGLGYIEFGDGGVDDAEDADIILHEYFHSVQDNINPGVFIKSSDKETRAMGEGSADYWVFSSGYEKSFEKGFPVSWIGEWDSRGYLVPANYLRNINTAKTYSDRTGDVYNDSLIWSGVLYDLFNVLGKQETDKLLIYSTFLLGVNPHFSDGAFSIIDVDVLLNPALNSNKDVVGYHHNEICQVMRDREILSETKCPYYSVITHCGDENNYLCGDVNADCFVNALDLGVLVDYLFVGGSIPVPEASADVNGDCEPNALDLGVMIDYLFSGGDDLTGCGKCLKIIKSTATQQDRQEAQEILDIAGLGIKVPSRTKQVSSVDSVSSIKIR